MSEVQWFYLGYGAALFGAGLLFGFLFSYLWFDNRMVHVERQLRRAKDKLDALDETLS